MSGVVGGRQVFKRCCWDRQAVFTAALSLTERGTTLPWLMGCNRPAGAPREGGISGSLGSLGVNHAFTAKPHDEIRESSCASRDPCHLKGLALGPSREKARAGGDQGSD